VQHVVRHDDIERGVAEGQVLCVTLTRPHELSSSQGYQGTVGPRVFGIEVPRVLVPALSEVLMVRSESLLLRHGPDRRSGTDLIICNAG